MHLVLGLARPDIRAEAFIGGAFARPGYYLFAIPLYLSLLLAMLSVVQLARANPDLLGCCAVCPTSLPQQPTA